ncbi:MAG: 5-(carboxyamino)imidazole ribonucleotide synthase [Bdellovibrionales bacterium]
MNKTLGILGGGQLGRMSAMAAARLGISCVIFTPENNSPASLVSAETIVADYDDENALEEFSKKVDVISYEFENIPVKTVAFLQNLKPVYPDERLLNVAQDRIAEKTFLNDINIPTTRWAHPKSPEDIVKTLNEWHTQEAIIKTARFGYDGKGQARISMDTDFETLWNQFKDQSLIIEEIVAFDCEISVIIARDINGHSEIYGPMINEHKNHILDRTIMPCPLNETIQNKAKQAILKLADEVGLVGVLTLELFITKDGNILANEIAPRTHNSGHWTIDACAVSQFENHVRTVCGLPAAAPARHSDCEMINLIGNDVEKINDYQAQPNACIHDYGKSETREGRKMGHITLLKNPND